MQEIEFGRSQLQQPAARIEDPAQSRLQLETLETVFLRRTRNLHRLTLTAKHRANPGRQLSRVERLAEIIVGADLEADDPVDVLLQCGEKNDRNMRIFGAHVAADFQA